MNGEHSNAPAPPTTDQRLYIEELRSTIGDLLAAGKCKLGWKTLWALRVCSGKELLAQDIPDDLTLKIPSNADVDYVLQVYKPEIGPDRQYVYVDSPTVPGLHCMAETAEKALACAPAQVARLRKDNANCTLEPKTAIHSSELQGPMTMLDAPERYDSTQASIWAVGYNKGYRDATNELRPQSAASGATTPSGASETGTQSPQESRDGQAQGSLASQEQSSPEAQVGHGESSEAEVSQGGEGVLEG